MLEESKDELELTNEKLDTTDKTLNIVANKLNIAVIDRVVQPIKKSITEYFIVMKNDNMSYKYYIIRGQLYIKSKQEKLNDFIEIKRLTGVPNASILWNKMKEQMKTQLDYNGNKLNIINISENEFLNKIQEIYDERKHILE